MVVISQNPVDNVIIGIVAIAFLVFVADKVIAKSIKLSKKFGISQIFIGLTVISIGTSLPEITTSVVASLDIVRGNINPFIASSTVLGTAIGSDIVQQSLIMGIVGLLAIIRLKVVHVKRNFLKTDGLVMVLAAILLWLFSLGGSISKGEGAVLFFGYILFLWFLWMKEDERIHDHKQIRLDGKDKKGIFIDLFHIIIGLAVIIFSAEYILRVAEFFVVMYGIGGSLIGITTIGIATALPELTTAITALFRGASSISIGTLIGSNITNPMLALGLGAMISSYHVPRPVIVFDIPVKIASGIILIWFLWKNRMFTRKEAMTMITIYFVYILVRLRYFPVDT
ncbi:MAG: sodium:calcium antiporter [Candidatus Woesearchaeota archaeon]|jgi:cation:H+ antiporter|nr:sodium:calcium antiporter [Candidatus Woesearchaeota archaeon]MDP6265557.1 sodium:calcium antiporter [Candidatus Woesearchaeota archaeon]MDP7323012.1 sodium:calcium antiporter [Candidatus Woesearchaeota archaeon]